jgi:hypothetical protein
VIPEFLSKDEVDALVHRSKQLLEDFSLDGHPLVGSHVLGHLNDVSLHW